MLMRQKVQLSDYKLKAHNQVEGVTTTSLDNSILAIHPSPPCSENYLKKIEFWFSN